MGETPVDSDPPLESDAIGSSASDAFLRELASTGAPPLSAELGTGEHVDRFRILGVIGRGGMGVVYDAHDERLGRRVALKLLHSHLVGQEERRSRFAREAKAAAAIAHPNVARILEVGDGDSGAYLVFEKVEGRTLRAVLREGPLSIARVAELGVRIACGLAAAHAAGVVHRDLKPENVIVDAEGGVKILDFGLAKTTRDDADGRTGEVLTTEGVVLGSPGYMSPEQALGKETSRATDIFSFGVLLFELATGTRPFKGDTAMESIVSTTRDDAPDPRALRSDLPRAFGDLVKRCLAKEPARRPTATELEDALRAMPAIEPSATRSRWGLAIGTAAIVLVAVVLLRRSFEVTHPSDRVVSDPAATSTSPSVALSGVAVLSPSTLSPRAAEREASPPPTAVGPAPSAVPRLQPPARAPGAPRALPSDPAAARTSASPAAAPTTAPSDEPSFAERK